MSAPLGLVAGQGDLPVDLAARAVREGAPIFVVRLAGSASPDLDTLPGRTMPVERPGDILAALKEAGCREVIFGGKVIRPPLLGMKPDRYAVRALFLRMTGVWAKDDSLNRAIASIFGNAGLTIVGPAERWPDLLAAEGVLGTRQPSPEDRVDVQAASAAALRVGLADRGQGAVARAGQVIAVEGRGHTDALLRRVSTLPGSGGVLVKLAKPQQDRRLDLPVIGPDTVTKAVHARLSGIAVEVGGAILVRREETIRLADESGIFLLGLPPTVRA